MYLRGLRYRSVHIPSHLQVWTNSRPHLIPFLATNSRFRLLLQRRSGTTRDYKTRGDPQNNGQRPQKSAPIRPITLFLISIPLGYALNWTLKQQDEGRDGASSDGFVKYTLASKDDISSTCSIFTLSPATSSPIDLDDPSLKRMITSVQFKQPQLQIARNYTLLPRKEDQDSQELRFLIRRERNGEVSGYLHRLPVGSEIEVRGVFPEYRLPSNIKRVVFLTGGTGIAPAMQAAEVLAGEADVHILHASRRREDCAGGVSDSAKRSSGSWSLWSWWQGPSVNNASQEKGAIVSELDLLKRRAESHNASGQARLLIDYFVDEEGTFIKPSDVQRLLQSTSDGKIGGDHRKKILFVSGPDGFINHWAAPKQWHQGREVQGKIGGVLSTLDLTGWEVVKL